MIVNDNLAGKYSVKGNLHFESKDLEYDYHKYHVHKSVVLNRIALCLALCMYSGFFFLDYMLGLENLRVSAALRLFFVPLSIGYTLFQTFHSSYYRWNEVYISLPLIAAALGHSLIAIENTLPDGYFVLATILMLLYNYMFSGLRLRFSMLIGLIFILLFNVTQIFLVEVRWNTLLFENFFLFSANLLGLVGNYVMERFGRADYVNRIEREQFILQIEEAKRNHEKLLENILPKAIVEELQEHGAVAPRFHPDVTVMFIDIVDFTRISDAVNAQDLVKTLNSFFSAIDRVLIKYHIEKLKTMGDAYICAAGIPQPTITHPLDSCLAAVEILKLVEQQNLWFGFQLQVRIGIHTGPVTAGVVGTFKFAYDIWGDTVNVASRLEQGSLPNRINISAATHERVQNHFLFEFRGRLPMKGKGNAEMYFIKDHRIEEQSLDKEIA
ncbi:MAG: adenylate/guanylate cyclase domain-containing protein [Oligoflexus sp.]